MTDPTPRPDDELVSAVLDGEATADERARVEADPAAGARLAELGAVRDLVAAPVAVPAEARASAIAAALAQFDAAAIPGDPASSGRHDAPPSTVDRHLPSDELATRRARRGGATGGRVLAAAAAIVVVVLGAAAVLGVLNPPADVNVASSPTAQESEPPRAADASGGASEAPPNESEPGVVTSTTSPTDPAGPSTTVSPVTSSSNFDALGSATVVTVDLGDLTSPRELRDRMLGIVDARTADASSGAPAPTTAPRQQDTVSQLASYASCASYLDAIDPELDQLLAVGAATFEGRSATVFAFSIDQVTHPAANGSIRIFAVDPTACTPLSVVTTR